MVPSYSRITGNIKFKGIPILNRCSLELELQKHLAKVLVETKFECNVTQSCINKIMSNFELFVNFSITKISVSYLQMLLLFLLQTYIHSS